MRDLLFRGVLVIALTFGSVSACTPGDVLPDSTDCAKYLQCDSTGSSLESVTCPASAAFFNPDINACDTLSECNALNGCPSTGHSYIPDKTDCTKFTICTDGVPTPAQCPVNFSWDVNTNKCIPTADAKCEQVTPPPFSCPSSGLEFYPDPLDAHKYYRCEDGKASLEDCGSGLVWNDLVKACVSP